MNLDADRVAWIVSALVNDLSAQPQACVLILDDFHLINSAPVLDVLRSLIAHPPPQLHLVLLTREDPTLPLARLRTAADLSNCAPSRCALRPTKLRAFARGDGRIAGARGDRRAGRAHRGLDRRLATGRARHAARADPADLIAALGGNHPYILSYLTEEVLAQLPPAAPGLSAPNIGADAYDRSTV